MVKITTGIENHYLAEHSQSSRSDIDFDIDSVLTDGGEIYRDSEDEALSKELSELGGKTLDAAYNLGKSLTSAYFEPRSFERWKDGRIFESVGVDKLKEWRGPKFYEFLGGERPIKEAESKSEGIKKSLPTTYTAETVHAPFALISGAKCATDIIAGNPPDPIYAAAFLANGYATMLQRYNRARAFNHLDEEEGEDWREEFDPTLSDYLDIY